MLLKGRKMVDLDRRLFVFGGLGALVGMTALGRVGRAMAQETTLEHVPGAVQYETIDDIPEITDDVFRGWVAEEFSVVLFYGSKPPTDVAGKMDRAGRIYVKIANEMGLTNKQVFRYDRQRVAEMLRTTEGVPDHTDRLYAVRGTPTILAFCDGEEVYRQEGSSAPEERLDDAVNYFVGELVKAKADCI